VKHRVAKGVCQQNSSRKARQNCTDQNNGGHKELSINKPYRCTKKGCVLPSTVCIHLRARNSTKPDTFFGLLEPDWDSVGTAPLIGAADKARERHFQYAANALIPHALP
jgi:hypothetical protein